MILKDVFPHNTPRLWLCLLALVVSTSLAGQSKEELQRQRDELNNKIAYTKKLIAESKQGQHTTNRELQALDRQITLRNRLIGNLSAEVREIEDESKRRSEEITSLEGDLDNMREEYAQMIYQAYKNRHSYDKLMFIFAADDFNQAYLRLKLMQRYGEVRAQHKEEILSKQSSLKAALIELESLKEDRMALLEEKSTEKSALSLDKTDRQVALSKLKEKEDELRKQQRQQETEREKINRAIQRIIDEELRADRNRAGGSFALTPEGKIISQNFEKNKGKLPWPVSRGVILQKFGQQPHASLPGITVDNKGIDIATDEGNDVRSIFGGEVTSVFAIPGAGQNVIVTHGAYKTVYTNMASVSVKKGQQVDAFEKLGILIGQNGSSIAHLEIWKVTSSGGSPQNPEYWISK